MQISQSFLCVYMQETAYEVWNGKYLSGMKLIYDVISVRESDNTMSFLTAMGIIFLFFTKASVEEKSKEIRRIIPAWSHSPIWISIIFQ